MGGLFGGSPKAPPLPPPPPPLPVYEPPPLPEPPPVAPIPDDDAKNLERKREEALRQQRSGRAQTFLTEDDERLG